jgi:hypothetical protein
VTDGDDRAEQLGGGLVLLDEARCAELACASARGRIAVTREHENAGGLPEFGDEGEPVFAGEIDVEHHHLGRISAAAVKASGPLAAVITQRSGSAAQEISRARPSRTASWSSTTSTPTRAARVPVRRMPGLVQ